MIGEKNRYVSVLKQKAGEFSAVSELADSVWNQWNPLLELLTGDEDDNSVIKQKAIHSVIKSCKAGATVFLDFDDISQIPAAYITEILATTEQAHLIPVPVVTLSSDPNLISAFKDFIATRGRCIGVRIYFNEIDNNIATNVDQLITSLALDVQTSHLFIDLEHIPEDFIPALTVALPITASQIPSLAQWNTVTLSGTGYPKVLEVPGASNAVLPRTEWELWQSVKSQLARMVKRIDSIGLSGLYTLQHRVEYRSARYFSGLLFNQLLNDF